ncbi:MAG: Nif3-like dinuclear metal center hexameric protein [Bacteroidales bacterium]|nr:Nif3-like dinuclear metal center hexameric protein [Bacteroidales bacterium]
MKIKDVIEYLESVAPLSYQEDYDNAGLITGDPDWELKRTLLCLDLTEAVMAEAVIKGCNLIISHHPFIFKGIKKLTPGTPETNILTKSITTHTAIYAIHTNLDNSLEGLNAFVMKALGISEYRVLRPFTGKLSKLVTFCPVDHAENVRNALFQAGAGHIGNYDQCSFNLQGTGTFRAYGKASPFVGEKNRIHQEPEIRIEVIFQNYLENEIISSLLKSHPYEEVAYDLYPLANSYTKAGAGLIGELAHPMKESGFLDLVKERLQIPYLRHSKLRGSPVRKVALCTGSGSFLIPDASKAGAHIFLTGDLKYHDFFLSSDQLVLADIGHYESEKGVKEWLFAVLIEKFPNFACLISEIDTNPVYYY